MSRINLLPWREQERQKRNREFIIQMLIVAAIGLLCAGLIWSYFNQQLSDQEQANALITQANVALDRQLEEIASLEERRGEIIDRMKVIEDLQGTRPIPVHVLDSLARAVPSNLYLTEVQRTDNLLVIRGRADNPNTVTDLVRNIDNSEWMQNSKVTSITNSNDSQALIPNDDGTLPMAETGYIQFEMNTQIAFPDVSALTDEPEVTNA